VARQRLDRLPRVLGGYAVAGSRSELCRSGDGSSPSHATCCGRQYYVSRTLFSHGIACFIVCPIVRPLMDGPLSSD